MYYELAKDPLIVAVFSALIGVALSQIAQHLYDFRKHATKRKAVLQVLESQLQQHVKQLGYLSKNLGNHSICGAMDASPIITFLNSDIVSFRTDRKFISALYDHLHNMEIIRRCLDRSMISAGGFTKTQYDNSQTLEANLSEVLPECQRELETCLNEIPKK